MDNKGHTDINNKDEFQVWLDGCYSSWKKSHYWALQIALVLVWLPVALQLLNLALQGKLDPMVQLPLFSKLIQLQYVSPAANMLIAIALATAAGSCFRFEPEADQTSTRQSAFLMLRSNVRKVTYSWLFMLMFIPSLASLLLWYSQIMIPTRFHPIPSHRWWFLLVTMSVYSVSCWICAEFSQYMNLRFSSKPVWARVSVVVNTVVVYLALITFDHLIFGQNPTGVAEVLRIVFGWIFVLALPCSAIHMMLATRKPTAPVLERM